MSLIVTSAPRDGESGTGYYRRLAADNALFNWRDLADIAGVERNGHALLTRPHVVAHNLGLDPEWTESAQMKEALCRSWGRFRRTKADAVCPACLAESLYLRHEWEHQYVSACPRHNIQLVDQCNACGSHLSPERLFLGLCSCGHDLANLPRVPATRVQQWLSTLIANEGSASGTLEPVLRGLDIDVLVKVIGILCLHADPMQYVLPGNQAVPKSVAEAVKFLAPLETLLAEWPTGFRAHVKQRIAVGNKDARTLNTLLGDWYIRLRKLCQSTPLELFLQVIIDVAAEQTDCVLGLDSAKSIAEEATGYMRSRDAARVIGVGISTLHAAIATDKCAHRTRRTGTRGQVHEIPYAEVERIQQQRAGWISDIAACELARVPPVVLERMKGAGIIRSDIRWREDLLKGGPVAHQSLLDLFERISQASDPAEPADDATITWAELTSRRMGDKGAIEALMQAIAAGELKAVTRARTLGDMPFRMSEVSPHFGTPLLEAGMSIEQLAKATGWKWESISHWIDEGLLASETIQRRGKPCRVVLPHQLLAFRQSYMPLADLARATGKTASALARLLPGIQMVGAKQLPDGAMRGGLIRISDLGRLAMLGARAGTDLFVPAE